MGLVWTSQIFPRTPRVTPLPLTFSHSVTHTHGLEMMRVNTLDEKLMETDNKSLLVLLGCFWCCVARTAGCSGHPSSEDTWRSWSLPVSSAALPGPESAAETTDWEGKQEHHFVAPQGNLRADVVGLKSGWGGSHRSFLEPNLHLQRLSIPAVNVRETSSLVTQIHLAGEVTWRAALQTIKAQSFLFSWVQLIHWRVEFRLEDL